MLPRVPLGVMPHSSLFKEAPSSELSIGQRRCPLVSIVIRITDNYTNVEFLNKIYCYLPFVRVESVVDTYASF